LRTRHLLNTLENALNPLLHVNGSISNLNKDMIPEASEGFAIVQSWALYALRTLDPSKHEAQGDFLTNLSKAFTLRRLRQNDDDFDSCLCSIPSATSLEQRHPRLVVDLPDGKQLYALSYFTAFIDGSGDLGHGIRFFRCSFSQTSK
jgi:hypothetical protein